jgi:hypothetical protein
MKTEVRIYNGRPTLLIDGQPHHGLFGSSPPSYMRNLLDAGFDIIDTHPQTSTGWMGPDVFDYSATDARVESYLKQSASAKLIIRFWLGYPHQRGKEEPQFWWMREHPEENARPLALASGRSMPWDEVTDQLPLGQLISINDGAQNVGKKRINPARPSFASLLFREQAGEALCRVVAHLEAKYGDRIVAYAPGGGPCGEGFHWSADDPRMMDYSAPMARAFQLHLQENYGDISTLNKAWNTWFEGFSDITLPSVEQRYRPTHGHLRSVTRERAIIDFLETYHRVVSETLLHWAAKTKEGCLRRKVVMIFYGYLWNHNYGDAQARSGHARLQDILRSPDVDAIVSPFSYSLRQMDGVMTGQGLAAAARRHGKLYVHELDGSTNLRACWNCPDHHTPKTAQETGELFRRELNKIICEGSSGWYMDLPGGYFDEVQVTTELNRTLEKGSLVRAGAGLPNAQVAVVLDSRASFYFREGEPLLSPLIDMFKQHSLARMGLGFDDFSLEDLEDFSPEKTAHYKLWIFPCAVHLTPSNLNDIRRHACRNGNHMLWNYAVNVCTGDLLDLPGMEQATGFRCGASLEPGELSVTVPPGPHPWTVGLEENLVYGTHGDLSPDDIRYHAVLEMYPTTDKGFRIKPRFFIEAGGEAIGWITDLPGEPAGLSVRQMEGWVSVLSCAPLIPPILLRRMARDSGCHVYTDFASQVVQCENTVGLFFHDEGPCFIRLPRVASRVTELYSGQTMAGGVQEFVYSARRNHAALFRFE